MELVGILNYSLTFLSLIIAALAWIAKIRWSKEFKEAKEAQIQALKERIGLYESVISTKLIDHSKKTINDLEILLAQTEESKQYEINKILNELKEQEKIIEEDWETNFSFLGNISHELRTPLNAILGFAELLEYKGINDNDKNDYLQIIKSNSYRILDVTNELITMSKSLHQYKTRNKKR